MARHARIAGLAAGNHAHSWGRARARAQAAVGLGEEGGLGAELALALGALAERLALGDEARELQRVHR
ncbi:MAG: hypothetical protein IPK07_07330 [Deltaproteobacteria bacterium]|nr:hypothetical protein [Deltaproteobacteria bacterium]